MAPCLLSLKLFVSFLTFRFKLWLSFILERKQTGGTKGSNQGELLKLLPCRPTDLEMAMLLRIPTVNARLLPSPAATESLRTAWSGHYVNLMEVHRGGVDAKPRLGSPLPVQRGSTRVSRESVMDVDWRSLLSAPLNSWPHARGEVKAPRRKVEPRRIDISHIQAHIDTHTGGRFTHNKAPHAHTMAKEDSISYAIIGL